MSGARADNPSAAIADLLRARKQDQPGANAAAGIGGFVGSTAALTWMLLHV
jgi:hypothetical protein